LFKYFTVQTANEALPSVIQKFENAKKQKVEVMKTEQQLQITLSDIHTFEQSVELKQKLNQEMTKLYKSIEELEATGVVLKGLDQGLLDFPSKRFDDDVWLCWKEGEKEIKFWHEMDTGFNGRKPISVDTESLV
tara:strand:- start:5209 stop:5610 length:402 start_codon:yes stop_codon:yes gene_type:complete